MGTSTFAKNGWFPLPTVYRSQTSRRFAYRNERNYIKINVILAEKYYSIYSPDKNLKVYSQEIWWSDKWDGRDYGRDFDFSRPFLINFRAKIVDSKKSLLNSNGENSEYCNLTTDNKTAI